MANTSSTRSGNQFGNESKNKAQESAGTMMEDIKETAGSAADKAREFAGNAADKAREFAGTAADKAKEFASSAASGVPEGRGIRFLRRGQSWRRGLRGRLRHEVAGRHHSRTGAARRRPWQQRRRGRQRPRNQWPIYRRRRPERHDERRHRGHPPQSDSGADDRLWRRLSAGLCPVFS